MVFHQSMDVQLAKLVIEPLQRLHSAGFDFKDSPFVIIIDGLDECHGINIQSGLVRSLAAAFSHSSHRIHIIIVSRPEVYLQSTFNRPLCNLMCHDSLSLTNIPRKRISIYFWKTRLTRSDANIHSPPTFHLLGLLLRSFVSSGGNHQASSSLHRRQSSTSAEILTNFQHAVWMSFAAFSLLEEMRTCHTQT